MDSESRQAARLLETLGRSNERLIDLAVSLRTRPEVSSVTQNLTVRGYRSGPVLEAYVDAELRSGIAVCWWMQVTWRDDGWLIESSVLANREQGQDTIRELPTRSAQTIEGFIVALEQATQVLIESASGLEWPP